ncbi:MAG TPA: DUF4260 domain-containing protein [Terracidiphilus sp.]|nr:DUF4260 domain-containing protein [Terracidiphilus sp.]
MASSASLGPLASSSAPVRGSVLTLLRLEGLAVAAITVILYARTGASWWLFAAVWLVPDLSMLGYLHCSCWGARAYNAVHTYIGPAVLALFGLVAGAHYALPVALIWANHIGVDRLLGYGLKYGDGFGFTHLGRLGNQREITSQN